MEPLKSVMKDDPRRLKADEMYDNLPEDVKQGVTMAEIVQMQVGCRAPVSVPDVTPPIHKGERLTTWVWSESNKQAKARGVYAFNMMYGFDLATEDIDIFSRL